MARRRYESTEMSGDKKLNKLINEYGFAAGLLYDRMILHAEDNCEVISDSYEIKMKIVPGINEYTEEIIQNSVMGMIEIGLLQSYEKDEKIIFMFPPKNFYKYQSYIAENKRDYRNAAERGKTPNITAKRRTSPQNAEHHRKTPNITASPSPSPSPSPIEREIDMRAREDIDNDVIGVDDNKNDDTKIDFAIKKINDKAFEFGMNGISPEFIQDSEMRLNEGTADVELILKALSIGATNATGNAGAKCRYAIKTLMGWAAEGINSFDEWEKRNTFLPKPRDKPNGSQQDRNARYEQAEKEALRILEEQGVLNDDESGMCKNNRPP